MKQWIDFCRMRLIALMEESLKIKKRAKLKNLRPDLTPAAILRLEELSQGIQICNTIIYELEEYVKADVGKAPIPATIAAHNRRST